MPFLFSGFWSKEAILHAAHAWDVSHLPLYFGLTAVVLTAFYMTRLVAGTFFGKPRSHSAGLAEESPAVMTVPLVILAFGAVVAGLVALWREALLVQAVLRGHTVGYRSHPQLARFRAQERPMAAIAAKNICS